MRVYEELFIVRPDATEEELTPLIEQIEAIITGGGGTVDKTEKWGVRKLAYRVQKRTEGNYVLIQFSAGPELVKELERRLRVSDMVLKFITVRIDEKLKRIDKRKKEREKRAARKPVREAAAPAPVMPGEAPAMPGAPMPGAPVPGAPAPGAPTPAETTEEATEPVTE
jgi:small subunit ribosomal protein S6